VTAPSLHPQLAEVVGSLDEASSRLRRLAGELPPERWSARRDPDRWSVAECVAHLNLTSRAYLPLLMEALAEARAINAPIPERYRRDVRGWLIARMAGPMPGLGRLRVGRMRTPVAFVPEGELPRERVLAEFEGLQEELAALVREGNGLPLGRVQVVSPFDARMRYTLWSAFTILPAHEHRHLEQAERVWGD
jgi:hypothetical protein